MSPQTAASASQQRVPSDPVRQRCLGDGASGSAGWEDSRRSPGAASLHASAWHGTHGARHGPAVAGSSPASVGAPGLASAERAGGSLLEPGGIPVRAWGDPCQGARGSLSVSGGCLPEPRGDTCQGVGGFLSELGGSLSVSGGIPVRTRLDPGQGMGESLPECRWIPVRVRGDPCQYLGGMPARTQGGPCQYLGRSLSVPEGTPVRTPVDGGSPSGRGRQLEPGGHHPGNQGRGHSTREAGTDSAADLGAER